MQIVGRVLAPAGSGFGGCEYPPYAYADCVNEKAGDPIAGFTSAS
jgi:hypothetical protein